MSDSINNQDTVKLPEYMGKTHSSLYLNPKYISFWDKPFIVNLKSFFYANKLAKIAADEVLSEDKVLQMGFAYGDQIYKLSDKVGDDGNYDIVDVAKPQIDYWLDKLETYPQVSIYHDDAEFFSPEDEKYDVVLSFFLLHDVPDAKKTRIIDNMLNCLNDDENAKLIVIDYAKYQSWNVFGHIARYITRLYSPFTESIFDNEISKFCSNPDDYIWSKETFFGGLYQKTTVMKKL